jgi:hypothetical protein
MEANPTGPRNQRRPGRCRQCLGLLRGDGRWLVADALPKLEMQPDAHLTDRGSVKRQLAANFALPCAVDCVKRQQFGAWKGGRVV